MCTADDIVTLLPGAVRRDPDAWEALYRRMYTRLFSYARRRLREDAQADDAVSETMVRALHRIDAFEPCGFGLEGWLYGILRNVLREMSRSAVRCIDGIGEGPDGGSEPDPLAFVLHDEQVRQVRVAFDRLSPADQEVLELRVLGDLSADHVAAVIGKRPGAVRMAQSRALVRLRELLQEVSGAE